jgi:RNA polymerase sigma factor (sigma-70 family)
MLAAKASIAQVEDGDLVEQVRAGNAAAFGELVERHQAAIYRAALAALGNTADAEEIAQDALVLAFKRIGQFRGLSSVRTWMVSIAWRLALSRRRRSWWKLANVMGSEAELADIETFTPSPATRLESAQSIERIQREIRRLPPKLRDALLLAAAGDLTQDEIAAALKIPGATFRGRVRDARLRLKARLEKQS